MYNKTVRRFSFTGRWLALGRASLLVVEVRRFRACVSSIASFFHAAHRHMRCAYEWVRERTSVYNSTDEWHLEDARPNWCSSVRRLNAYRNTPIDVVITRIVFMVWPTVFRSSIASTKVYELRIRILTAVSTLSFAYTRSSVFRRLKNRKTTKRIVLNCFAVDCVMVTNALILLNFPEQMQTNDAHRICSLKLSVDFCFFFPPIAIQCWLTPHHRRATEEEKSTMKNHLSHTNVGRPVIFETLTSQSMKEKNSNKFNE